MNFRDLTSLTKNVLFSRTQPLIRYELSDRVAAAPGQPDDLPFAVLAGIEGREEDVLSLGGVTVFPNVFHSALERLPVAGWQVIDEGGRLRVLLAGGSSIDTAATAESVRLALARVGVVEVPVRSTWSRRSRERRWARPRWCVGNRSPAAH